MASKSNKKATASKMLSVLTGNYTDKDIVQPVVRNPIEPEEKSSNKRTPPETTTEVKEHPYGASRQYTREEIPRAINPNLRTNVSRDPYSGELIPKTPDKPESHKRFDTLSTDSKTKLPPTGPTQKGSKQSNSKKG